MKPQIPILLVSLAMLAATCAPCFAAKSEANAPTAKTTTKKGGEGKMERQISVAQPIAQQGCISFRMKPDKTYHNGEGQESLTVPVLTVPGLAQCQFKQADNECQFIWKFSESDKAAGLVAHLPELPGPEPYWVQFTWDTKAGKSDGYVNGTPLRVPNTKLPPWTVKEANEIQIMQGAFEVADVSFEPRYVGMDEARKSVPPDLLGRRGELFGAPQTCKPMDIEKRRGALLYEASFGDKDAVKDWTLEGPGILDFKDGWLNMSSSRPDGPEGHCVYWCPRDFPDRFVAEWEVQPTSEAGLCIVFFAARGAKGEDIFDPSLPKRNGVFTLYTKGAINSYHISYYANTPDALGRITANLRKNNKFYLVAVGPPGIAPGSKDVHKIRLVKDGAHIQALVDGGVVIDSTDDGKRYGPVYKDGKIGLRQMQWMTARYRSFRVWALNE